jgi:hypothetical protein
MVLWCYAHARPLAEQGNWVVCLAAMPNERVRERGPIPGSIMQREFESTRHGTVNLLAFLVVHTGRMEAAIRETNVAEHLIAHVMASWPESNRLYAHSFEWTWTNQKDAPLVRGARQGHRTIKFACAKGLRR